MTVNEYIATILDGGGKVTLTKERRTTHLGTVNVLYRLDSEYPHPSEGAGTIRTTTRAQCLRALFELAEIDLGFDDDGPYHTEDGIRVHYELSEAAERAEQCSKCLWWFPEGDIDGMTMQCCSCVSGGAIDNPTRGAERREWVTA